MKSGSWEYLHVVVDASRLAYTEMLPDERKSSAITFLERALAWFACHGVKIERISHQWLDAKLYPKTAVVTCGKTENSQVILTA